jgi:hypothetical protein
MRLEPSYGVTVNVPFIVRKCAEQAYAYVPGVNVSVYRFVPIHRIPVVKSRLFSVCDPSAKLWNRE